MHMKTDSEIEQAVLKELCLNQNICSREVCVFANKGVVRLKGSALSYEDKLTIAESARHTKGVVDVVNEMTVKPCPSTCMTEFSASAHAFFLKENSNQPWMRFDEYLGLGTLLPAHKHHGRSTHSAKR